MCCLRCLAAAPVRAAFSPQSPPQRDRRAPALRPGAEACPDCRGRVSSCRRAPEELQGSESPCTCAGFWPRFQAPCVERSGMCSSFRAGLLGERTPASNEFDSSRHSARRSSACADSSSSLQIRSATRSRTLCTSRPHVADSADPNSASTRASLRTPGPRSPVRLLPRLVSYVPAQLIPAS